MTVDRDLGRVEGKLEAIAELISKLSGKADSLIQGHSATSHQIDVIAQDVSDAKAVAERAVRSADGNRQAILDIQKGIDATNRERELEKAKMTGVMIALTAVSSTIGASGAFVISNWKWLVSFFKGNV